MPIGAFRLNTLSAASAVVETGPLSWFLSLTSSDGQGCSLTSCDVTSAGDIYITGEYQDSSFIPDIILLKLNTYGTSQWQRSLTQSGYNSPQSVTVDSNGQPFVFGYTASNDTFAVKYTTEGILSATHTLTSAGNDWWHGSTLMSSNNTMIACGFTGSGTAGDAFFARYTNTLSFEFQRKITSSGTAADRFYDVITNGTYYVFVGKFGGTNGAVISCVAESSNFHQWTRTLGSTTTRSFTGITTDNTNAYVCGIDTDGQLLILKFNSVFSSTVTTIGWQRKLATGAGSNPKIAYSSTTSNCYVVCNGFDTTGYILIASYSSTGTLNWQKKITCSAGELGGSGVDIKISGSYLIVSSAYGDVTSGKSIGVVAKLDIAGPTNGTYGIFTIASGSYTGTTPTNTLATPSATLSTPTLTSSTTNPMSAGSYSFNSSKTTIIA